MSRRVKIEGLHALEKKLRDLPDEIYAGAREGTAESVDAVYTDMRRNVPRQSGMLRDAIGKRVTGALRGAVGIFGSKRAWWGALVEFGTARTFAQPFAQPAAEAEAERYPKRLAAAINKRLGRLTE